MTSHMLDTCVCVQLLRGRAATAADRLSRLLAGSVGLSSIVLGELHYGAAKSAHPAKHLDILKRFLAPLTVWVFDAQASEIYGLLRAGLERAGRPIGSMDTLIASHALALDATLITSNEREFRRVSGLRVENWLA
ncbi:MAG: type II toxin-antitoxin system VapC family toxin [Phycisphaerae bacterium]|nr:type II toxin-antitoxin system VapC family toxin [Phycisphaerae bacterium]